VLVVEHKPEAIAIADHVVDLGPGAGTGGGEVVFEGTVEELRSSATLTGRHLDDRACLKATVRTPTGTLDIRRAGTHNLRDVDVDIPLGVLVVVTGVAGSGKSSLIHGSVSGRDGVVSVDQVAIRGSRRSNPATYTGLLDPIRKAFAKANGVKPALFSANSEGACPSCNGAGAEVDDVVADRDRLRVVLHDEHRVALVAQRDQQVVHPLDVVRVQADRRLVEDVGDVGE
jgi:excinuclease UvrABC ATPase subunit